MNQYTRHIIAVAAAALAGVSLPMSAGAYSSGPPDFSTGAPGESTCGVAGCHGNLNIGSGSVSLSAPSEYHPGDTIDIIVNLQMLGQKRWGFEATVLNSQNQPVGTILISEPTRTQLSNAPGGRQYVKHTSTGTDPGILDAAPGWSFKWITPAEGTGAVTFYVAGNAANNSLTNLGDYIYTGSAQVGEGIATAVDDPFVSLPYEATLSPNYPNPFNPSTTIVYTLPRGADVSLTIFNVIGQSVRTVESGYRSAGAHAVQWDGRDTGGGEVASGIYFYRLVAGEFTATRKMVLAR